MLTYFERRAARRAAAALKVAAAVVRATTLKAEAAPKAAEAPPPDGPTLKAAEVLAVPFTVEEFTAEMDKLVARANAAGLSTLQVISERYIKPPGAVLEKTVAKEEKKGDVPAEEKK